MAHFVYPTVNSAQQAGYPPQTAYVAAPQAAYAAAAPRAAQAYESYQAVNAAPQYAYHTAGTRVAVSPAATYDQAKAYYQPAQAAVPASHYATADSHYQVSRETVRVPVAIVSSAKPPYSAATSYSTHTQRQPPAPKAQAIQVSSTPAASFVYNVTTTAAPAMSYASSYSKPITAAAPAYSSYDSALYSAATSYYQQQHKGGAGAASTGTSSTVATSAIPAASAANAWAGYKKGNLFVRKPAALNKGPPKPAQLHYCDVCKISCAGPLTYKEHLEGQKHKKKEASMKTTAPSPSTASRNALYQLRCELCDVTCTGGDAYAAHIRGAKHQKVLKLHQKLGKPIPPPDPHYQPSTTTAGIVSTGTGTQEKAKPKGIAAMITTGTKKITAAPKINFVAGSTLKMQGGKAEEVADKTEKDADSDAEDMEDQLIGETTVAPVGHEYIEETQEPGKSVSFNCKLCECKFNDPNAKDMHMKGRRHRLQFKKRVDPTLQVEIKTSTRTRRIQEDKLRRQAQKEEQWRRRLEEERWRDEMRMEEQVYWQERRRYEEEMEYYEWQRQQGLTPPLPPRPFPRPRPPMQMRRPDSSDDRHVMAKHNSIYPNESELQAVQNIVSACEKTLKLVSDYITESDGPKTKMDVDVKKAAEKKAADAAKDAEEPTRLLKGVMRVGVLAKGLLLHGDLNVNLVVLCSEKPTRTLLERLADNLPKQLAALTDQKFEVKRCVEEAAIIVTSEQDMPTSCTITLTSPIMRESNVPEGETSSVSIKDPPDVLDRQKCLDALAALRHAKWFQAKANGLQSCVILIRILRDLCQRVPTWTPLSEWAMELLVEKCVSSGGNNNMTPGDALRRVFECIASGILLPGGPGLYDPCEKEASEAAGGLTNQQREEITASAQHALRLIAFRQIHKVLGMDPLPARPYKPRTFNTRNLKRRHTNSQGEGEEGSEKKDKKEEDGKESMDTSGVKQAA